MGEQNSDLLMPCFQMLNEQQKRVSSAVKLIKLQESDVRVESMTQIGRNKGEGN